jgi:phosphate transport system substrate-binding protein
MTRRTCVRRLFARALALVVPLTMVAWIVSVPRAPAGANPAAVNGSGSTYVALAMQQWVADAQTAGLSVNYLPTGSPDGLTSYANGLTDFAGTEAEFSALSGTDAGARRGYQYVPDVAGAVAVMYNVDDQAGRKVDYLHLSMRTIARIFTGDISNWSDPAISADNKGLVLPNQPITVVYRAGQSGTTALFYDFVSHVAPDVFGPWAARNRLPTDVRIIQLDGTPGFAPHTTALSGSDQIAQFVGSDSGKWSIAYDEFGYAKVYNVPAAWVQNASGNWVQPYAQNIAAALQSATLRPDLSQELSGVYASTDPGTYPISAYSYIVTQCAPSGDRPLCKGAYPNGGVSETMAKWLRSIACDGQVNMARIGYSPLPPNLSQEMVNSVARLTGATPEQLNADNCANPTFHGSLGAGASSPGDPLASVGSLAGGGGGQGSGGSTSGGAGTAAAGTTTAGSGGTATEAAGSAAALKKQQQALTGGSSVTRDPSPIAYTRPGIPTTPSLLVIVLVGVIVVPIGIASGLRSRRSP